MKSVRLSELSELQIERCLTGQGLGLELASFRCLVRSDTGLLSKPLKQLYKSYGVDLVPHGFYDFRVRLNKSRESFLGSWQVKFDWEGNSPFPGLPLAHTHPLFEWGLNWCVATASGTNTVIHSAVVERNGLALVLPGSPGSGKSTLCAALALTDWRLLSDELTIISHANGQIQPMPRPISLKNKSIDVIRNHVPTADMTIPVTDTHKGSIAYARAPDGALATDKQAVPVGYVVFPKFVAGAVLDFEPLSRAEALAELMEHTFNVGLLGAEGFVALAKAISEAKCYAVEYGDLTSILNWIDTTCLPTS